MTSKEQTIKRIEAQKEKIEEHKKEYGRVSLFDKLELKYLESVLKDLEVLETLKSKIGLNYIPTQVGIEQEKYILTGVEITKQEYNTIKEWLNG